jgi:hypothetical protein
MSGQGSSID